jgi:hypothetical protein
MGDSRLPHLDFPPHRAVILGASNVVRDLATMVETARRALAGPLDLLAAVGHGRGYARPSRVLGRALPSIVDCGLWEALAARPGARTYALLTDIGNDLLYGATVDEVVQSVAICLQRLADHCQRIAITELPLETLRGLAPRRFLLLRKLLFPSSRLTLDAALTAAAELNRRVVDLATPYGATIRRPVAAWYGYDPIHIRRGWRATAWRDFFSAWRDPEDAEPLPLVRGSWWRWLHLSTRRPQRRRLFGMEQRRDQPVCRLPDGTWISLF